MNIFACVACNYPSLPIKFVMSLWMMQFKFYQWQIAHNRKDTLSLVIGGGYNLDKMRDDCAIDAIKQGADMLLLLDTDMSFPEDMIIRMIQVLEANPEYDAISGIYTSKKEPYLPQIFTKLRKDNTFVRCINFPTTQPFEIAGAGAGCLMIKKEVFKKPPFFKFIYTNEQKDLPLGMGEDLYFFWKHRPKTLCDPTIACGHYDTRPITLQNYISKNKLKIKNNQISVTKVQIKKMEKLVNNKK